MRKLITKVMLNSTGQWAIFYFIGLTGWRIAIRKYFKTKEIAERWAKRFEDGKAKVIVRQKRPLSDIGKLLDNF